MRDDLLDADASVRWAVSNLSSFTERLNAWIAANIHVAVKNLPRDPEKDAVVAVTREPLPLIFNAEAGAYLNSIRSGLDILAVAIGKRDNVLFPDKIYFPVAKSAADFAAGRYNQDAAKFVKQLSPAHRKIIEKIKPYDRGNNLLFLLHHLDIERKHRRLLTLSAEPESFTVRSSRVRDGDLVYLADYATVQKAGNECLLAHITKGATNPDIQLSAKIVFDDARFGRARMPVVQAIQMFAQTADDIIRSFDC